MKAEFLLVGIKIIQNPRAFVFQVNKPSVTSVIFSQKFVIVRREEPRLQYYAITREIQVKVATKWTSVRSKIIHKILP